MNDMRRKQRIVSIYWSDIGKFDIDFGRMGEAMLQAKLNCKKKWRSEWAYFPGLSLA